MPRRPADPTYLEYVLDQLSRVPGVEARAMFGGHGLYAGEAFFAIVHRGRLFFRVDDASRGDFEARGMAPFRPGAKQTLKRYYEVPPDVVEDDAVLARWARRAARTTGRAVSAATRRRGRG